LKRTNANLLQQSRSGQQGGFVAPPPPKDKPDEWKSGLRQRFELIDSDNDGVISLEDFARFTRLKTPNSSDKQIKNIFAKMDTQNIGRVTWVEFEKCFRRFAEKKMALRKIPGVGKLSNRFKDGLAEFDEKKAFEQIGGKGKLHSLTVWTDLMVRGFRCVWTKKNGNKWTETVGQVHMAKNTNQKLCKMDKFELAHDEFVSSVIAWIDEKKNCVSGLALNTDKKKSHTYGVTKGKKYELKPPAKHSMHAFFGGFSNECFTLIGGYALLNYHKP